MNRRDFLRLMAALSAFGLFEGVLHMLPNSTNRYGDMLKDILSSVQGVDQSKVDNLQREMNELWSRETKYRSWLRLQDNKIGFNNLALPFEPIYSTVFENDKTELVVPISGNYHHIFMMGQARVTGAGAGGYIYAALNGDTGANYQYNTVYGQNTTAGAGNTTGWTGFAVVSPPADGTAVSFAGSFFAFIPHYSSSYYKTCMIFNCTSNSSYNQIVMTQGIWKNTSPINSITFTPDANSMAAGSLLSVYGIV